MRRIHLVTALGVMLAALAGCSGGGEPAETARTVLVVHPVAGPGADAEAFAGEVHAREESALAFQVGGHLVRREVDVGDRVRRGQVLARIDPADLQLQAQAAQAQLAAAEGELARARADQARYARLSQQQLVSRSALDAQDAAYAAAAGQAKAARAQLDLARNQSGYTQLRAPRDGVIASRLAEAGQVVGAGQTIFTLAGDGGREVAIALPEAGIRSFHVGQQALVEPWNAPDRRLPATIREIAPAADPQTRTYAARISLAGAASQAVELGQSARVYVIADGGSSALQLPLAAVQRGSKGAGAVWVVDPASHRLHLTPVRLGRFGEDSAPVLAGVSADAWIVAAGGHLLREGQLVAPVDRDDRPVLPAVAATTAAR